MTSVSTAAAQIRKEEATRARLYDRFARIIGAFDASEMSAAEIAKHGLKKLLPDRLLPRNESDMVAAADSYLAGRDAANISAGRRTAMDSHEDNFVVRYLKGL